MQSVRSYSIQHLGTPALQCNEEPTSKNQEATSPQRLESVALPDSAVLFQLSISLSAVSRPFLSQSKVQTHARQKERAREREERERERERREGGREGGKGGADPGRERR